MGKLLEMMRLPTALKILRFRQWAHFSLLPLAGVDWTTLRHPAALLPVFPIATLASMSSLGFAYGINAITDRHTDRSRDKNPLAGLQEVPRSIRLVVASTFLSAVALSFVATCFFHAWSLEALTVSLLAGFLYSAGPRFKSVPVIGLVTNCLIFVPSMFAALGRGARTDSLGVLVCTFAALLAQNQILHERADFAEDSAGDDRTTARLLGRKGVVITIVVLGLANGIASWFLSPAPIVAAAAIASTAIATIPAMAGFLHAPTQRICHRYASIFGGGLLYLATLAVEADLLH
jgi:4-hydroxybenzoate polyprenyltransferase